MYLHIYVFVWIIHNGFRPSSHYVDITFGNRIRQAWPRWEWSWQRPSLSCLLILVTYCLCGFCCQVPSVHLYSGLPWLSVVGIVFLPSLCLSLFGSFTHSILSPIKWKKYFHTSLLFFLYVHMHLLMCIPSFLLFQKFYAIVKLDALIYQFTNDILHINGVHFFSKEFQKISLFLNYDKMSTLASVKEMVLSRERWGHNLQSHTVDNLVHRIRPVRIPLEYRSWKFLFDFSHIWCSQHLSIVLQLLVGVFLILSPDSFKLCR